MQLAGLMSSDCACSGGLMLCSGVQWQVVRRSSDTAARKQTSAWAEQAEGARVGVHSADAAVPARARCQNFAIHICLACSSWRSSSHSAAARAWRRSGATCAALLRAVGAVQAQAHFSNASLPNPRPALARWRPAGRAAAVGPPSRTCGRSSCVRGWNQQWDPPLLVLCVLTELEVLCRCKLPGTN